MPCFLFVHTEQRLKITVEGKIHIFHFLCDMMLPQEVIP